MHGAGLSYLQGRCSPRVIHFPYFLVPQCQFSGVLLVEVLDSIRGVVEIARLVPGLVFIIEAFLLDSIL
jgi:hypothetical protein